jgi:hypothetical protein
MKFFNKYNFFIDHPIGFLISSIIVSPFLVMGVIVLLKIIYELVIFWTRLFMGIPDMIDNLIKWNM